VSVFSLYIVRYGVYLVIYVLRYVFIVGLHFVVYVCICVCMYLFSLLVMCFVLSFFMHVVM